ncbi:MAG: DeoR/GlpR family DNA-binding transcription regulator [Sphaerochaetaceae bacterium]
MTKKKPRLDLLLSIINSQNFATIKQLAAEVGVSEMTIRRDLLQLENDKLVKSVYGGVTPIHIKGKPINTYTLKSEQSKNWDQKLAIAKKATEYIEPNDVVFFDTGSTVQALAEQMTNEHSYTFISSSLNTLSVLAQLKNSTVITPGGVFSYKPKVFYDLDTVTAIKKYRGNKCFIGATGYELDLGITCAYPEDAPIKQAMMDCSKMKILLIDSSKFGFVSTCKFASIEQFSLVITDQNIPDVYLDHITSHSVDVVLV